MTIQIPKKNILDKLLKLFGKERDVIFPVNGYEKFGPYAYFRSKRESFWKALFRSTISNNDKKY
ncbi:MAG: hypothetical protein HQK79_18125 [Desulfobacterales bacterium]|nr:hypothetical protein [Desulfobacterales bacterium]